MGKLSSEEVQRKIQTDDSYVIGALIALYQNQTVDEQGKHCSVYPNSVGFNALDAGILTSIAKYYLNKKTLTTKQIQLVRLKLGKYAKQLSIIDFNPVETRVADVKSEKRKERVARVFHKDLMLLEFPFCLEVNNAIKTINGWYYEPKTKEWSLPISIRAIELVKDLGFALDEFLTNWYDTNTKGLSSDIYVPQLDKVLRPFQKIAVSFIETRNGRVLIADEMGLGKSLEAIAWLLHKGEDAIPALIVCPASVKLNWLKEFKKWTNLGDHIEIINGTSIYEIEKLIAIINYDILFQWKEYIVEQFQPHLIIADEIHKCKSVSIKTKRDPKTGKWTKEVQTQRTFALETVAKKAKYVIGLTGTPFLNRPKEIFNPLKIIKPSLFPNFKSFGYRYCGPKHNGFAVEFNGASHTEELHKILSQEVMIRRKKEEVLTELPPKTFALLPMDIDNKKEYDKAEQNFLEYITQVNPQKVEAAKKAEALVQINYLRKLAVKGKLKESISWISDFIETDPLVVFAWHTDVIDTVLNTFPKEAVKVDGKVSQKNRNKAVEQFMSGDKTLFIGQIEAAGVGIDGLQKTCSNLAFIEYPWNPGLYGQACGRAHRIGQQNVVTIWNLVANGTIEETFISLLEQKAQMFDSVIDGIDTKEEDSFFRELLKKIKKNKMKGK